MSRITLKRARQNRPFNGRLKLIRTNGQGAFALPDAFGSYELRLFRHNNTTPFATGTVANGKITVTAAPDATLVTFAFPAADMAGLLGYGSMEFISTVPGRDALTVAPLQFVHESAALTVDDGEQLVIFDETIACVVETLTVIEGTAADAFASEAWAAAAARHLIWP